ncbi:thioredoxin reductase [Diaminobutyricimonas aerilata]|uniref:Thioredoxin reductase n=1 Tax=Diaminobutyricimonas aerilata TaxID=1162967 RepID=A0A2M9CGG7_9MICO|nr:FAD-dependent oxidoreductase [Diaminobutyricimonas aerilata]PJJ71026.1 thioredoxin reductase [Diaminobutyricimonas aerilata]
MSLVESRIASTIGEQVDPLPVAIIGAGPIGLAAAAHLAARDRPFVVFEAGATVGSSVLEWGHVRLFSPWRMLIDPVVADLLAPTGWVTPDADALPTGRELVERMLEPLAALPGIAPHIRVRTAVTAVTRRGMDRTRSTGRSDVPFVLRVRGDDGDVEFVARAVIDASGTWRTPNTLGSSGLDPLGLERVRDRVSPALPDVLGRDRAAFAGGHIVVAGAGHSAANTLLALAELARQEPGTRVSWLIRNRSAVRVTTAADDALSARSALGSRVDRLVTDGRIRLVDGFEILRLEEDDERMRIVGYRNGLVEDLVADRLVNATGFRPALDLLREIRLDLDEVVEAPRRLAPLIDPNVHTCGTVEPHGFAELRHPEADFFIAGMKSYGRAPTFLLATGFEQVRSIVAHLDGDAAAAREVRLSLPATGVCSTGSAVEECCS